MGLRESFILHPLLFLFSCLPFLLSSRKVLSFSAPSPHPHLISIQSVEAGGQGGDRSSEGSAGSWIRGTKYKLLVSFAHFSLQLLFSPKHTEPLPTRQNISSSADPGLPSSHSSPVVPAQKESISVQSPDAGPSSWLFTRPLSGFLPFPISNLRSRLASIIPTPRLPGPGYAPLIPKMHFKKICPALPLSLVHHGI